MGTRVDLHIHSKYSDRPSEWFLRRIGAPESFVEPLSLYNTCRARGMNYVTVTDHNSISGALEIACLPGTFLSSEITTYFPEDRCKIHCLVFGITEQQFREIEEVRQSIYDLQAYLEEQDVIHAVAHPLFRNNDRLTTDHVEKLLLMFKRFELLNGSRCSRASDMLSVIFDTLTPELVEEMADRHGIEPMGPEPWKKYLTGGSDDHGGLYGAGAYTVTPEAATVFDFLQFLREGQHRAAGRAGTSLQLAHSLYHIAYSYYRSRFVKAGRGEEGLIGALLKRLADSEAATTVSGLRAVVPAPIQRFIRNRRKSRLSEIERLIVDEFVALRERQAGEAEPSPPLWEKDERQFHLAARIGQQLGFVFVQRFMDQVRQGSLVDSLQSLSSLGPVLLGMAPYLTAFGAQHKDEEFLRSVAARFPGAHHLAQKTGKKVWLTDTFNDVNGVSLTIGTLARLAREQGREITVVTSMNAAPQVDFDLRNFEPVGTFALPEYESQTVVFPPFLELLEFIEREAFDEIIVSTPGPMGLVALAAARLFQLKIKGVYHTDFPSYVSALTDDDYLEDAMWRFMLWFYGGMDTIYVPSRHYLERLAERGFARERLRILPRGVNLERFHPGKRQAGFWDRFGVNGGFKFIYVGRVSREKNLDVLLHAFRLVQARYDDVQLVIVGDGPYLETLRSAANDEAVVFTGYLRGEDLARAYAGADTFVFPSMTDTFGNAVLEAHASGLPAIVSTEGGPAEIVKGHDSGLVVDAGYPESLAAAMIRLRGDSRLRERMASGAMAKAGESRWETVLDLI